MIQTSFAPFEEIAVRLLASPSVLGCGTATWLHAAPFHRATRPVCALPSPPPIAYASVGLMSVTPSPIWPPSAVARLGETDQAVPFQCRPRGAKSSRFTAVCPTAQASAALPALAATR